MSQVALTAEVAGMLALPREAASSLKIEPCTASGNNRVFVVALPDRKLVAKCYFRHPADTRDRLRAEYSFLTYARRAGITCVPYPVACDSERGIALYEYVRGQPIEAADVRADHVDQAAAFFLALNAPDQRDAARQLAPASEACLTVQEHFDMVDARIARLAQFQAACDLDMEARGFVVQLADLWGGVKGDILVKAARARVDVREQVEEQCVSPSDFGFHNALLREDRQITFLDFEYAGRDDPAKMVGDFFTHPAVPVDGAWFERFLERSMSFSPVAARLAERARMLLPVFRTKWCCIILNDFLPDSAQRRRFADPGFDEPRRKRAQLDKARRLFEVIRT